MKKIILTSILLVFILNKAFNQDSTSCNNINGILVLFTGNYNEKTNYKIYNIDQTIYAEIKSKSGNEPSCTILKDKIFAYFDDYYIFHFKGKYNQKSNNYEVIIGDSIKIIHKDNNMEFLTYQQYVLKFYCKASTNNPLRNKPSITSSIVEVTNKKISFKCLEIKGDWVKVECNKECDECPNNKKVEGWIRWRKDGIMILKQFYIC